MTYVWTCSSRLQFDVRFLALSKTRNWPDVTNKTYLNLPVYCLWMLYRLVRRGVFNTIDYKTSWLLTIHELPHILDKSVDNSKCMSCGGSSLVLSESVQHLQNCLDVLLLEKSIYKLDYAALRKCKTSARADSLDRFCLSRSVTTASVLINSTRILATISCIAGVGGIRV